MFEVIKFKVSEGVKGMNTKEDENWKVYKMGDSGYYSIRNNCGLAITIEAGKEIFHDQDSYAECELIKDFAIETELYYPLEIKTLGKDGNIVESISYLRLAIIRGEEVDEFFGHLGILGSSIGWNIPIDFAYYLKSILMGLVEPDCLKIELNF